MEVLRSKLLNEFEHKGGIIFNSDIFYNTKKFQLAFTIWKAKYNSSTSRFKYKLKDYKKGIDFDSDIEIYNTDYDIAFKDWIKPNPIKTYTNIIPIFNNSEEVTDKGVRCDNKCLGYYVNNSNNIEQSKKRVFIINGQYTYKKGFFITEDNVSKVLSNFATRRILVSNNKGDLWKIEKKQLLKPDIKYYRYEEWESDSIIYSIFNKYLGAKSLRNIDIKFINKEEVNKKIDLYNQFFFMSKDEIYILSKLYNNDDIKNDIELHGIEDRYIYKEVLINTILSEEAKDVLDNAKDIIYKTFKYRKNSKIEGINTWDAGWNQIMSMIDKYSKKESNINYEIKDIIDSFERSYKKLEEKLNLLIYELGILI